MQLFTYIIYSYSFSRQNIKAVFLFNPLREKTLRRFFSQLFLLFPFHYVMLWVTAVLLQQAANKHLIFHQDHAQWLQWCYWLKEQTESNGAKVMALSDRHWWNAAYREGNLLRRYTRSVQLMYVYVG